VLAVEVRPTGISPSSSAGGRALAERGGGLTVLFRRDVDAELAAFTWRRDVTIEKKGSVLVASNGGSGSQITRPRDLLRKSAEI
jgi:hypothetical protein